MSDISSSDSAAMEFGPNDGYLKEMYKLYLTDPSLVSSEWVQYFQGSYTPAQSETQADFKPTHIEQPLLPHTNGNSTNGQVAQEASTTSNALTVKLVQAIAFYRERGHLLAKISPLDSVSPERPLTAGADSEPVFSEEELNTQTDLFNSSKTVKETLELLKSTYCSSIGYEYTHIHNKEEREWLQDQIEEEGLELGTDLKQSILKDLIEAEIFESMLHTKYIGHKRFSGQGSDSMMPLLRAIIEAASEHGVKETVIGMPHRGRLTTLANILEMPIEQILVEFEDKTEAAEYGGGDVKYHIGFEGEIDLSNQGTVQATLAYNPSHLEFVHPVVLGISRAKQNEAKNRSDILPVVFHGDAASIGQGVVAESYNLMSVEGYSVEGTINIIVNNQVGFTTSPGEGRSAPYSSEVAKSFQIPVIHVNNESPEDVVRVGMLAARYRQRFGKDIVIDLYGYRKYGHNEGDDPSYTQPLMYSEIKKKKAPYLAYAEQLRTSSSIDEDFVDSVISEYKENFEQALTSAKEDRQIEQTSLTNTLPTSDTGLDKTTLDQIAETLVTYPSDFTIHPKLKALMQKRVDAFKSEASKVDWGFAEVLAFGSLLLENNSIRLSGQDCGRGTFSHRHAVLTDNTTAQNYLPLSTLAGEGQQITVLNSTLSEAAVMGFEYGYALEDPNTLVMWEGQFGDFANGAQVIIDQFITSGETKWKQTTGLVLLLPHGSEGQGPEHSSARLERYLQLCAEKNMSVCYPSTASQYFHMLRRHMKQEVMRPLIVMTPKSMLRADDASSPIEEFTSGSFLPVINDYPLTPEQVHTVFFCTGKISHQLRHLLENESCGNATIVRIEQLYPFPEEQLESFIEQHAGVQSLCWVQEEPQNQGTWSYIDSKFRYMLDLDLEYIGRPESASTATGSAKRHAYEVETILAQVKQKIS